jgi:DNA segregation ATPase FtsK/SpoIIIE-like protein
MNHQSINRRHCFYALGAAIVSPPLIVTKGSGELPQSIAGIDASPPPAISLPDPLYAMAVDAVVRNQKASSSVVQRHLKIGYNRAIRLLDAMENSGVVSALNAAGKREILASQSNPLFENSTISQST